MPDIPEAPISPVSSRGDRGPRFGRPGRGPGRRRRGGIFGLLFLIFLVLKLTGVIDWSWWWVTAPLWIGFVLGTASFLLLVVPLVIIFRRLRRRE